MDKSVYVKQVYITPELAKTMLDNNISGQRTARITRITQLQTLMNQGKFDGIHTVDCIGISITGKLLNGQHRLHAIIETGVSYWHWVMYGLKEEAYDHIDTGVTRTGRDALKKIGVLNYSSIAAISRLFILAEDAISGDRRFRTRCIPPAEIHEWYDDHQWVDEIYRTMVYPTSSFNISPYRAACVLCCSYNLDNPDVVEDILKFFADAACGSGDGGMASTLSQWWANARHRGIMERVKFHDYHMMEAAIKAWNYHAAGKFVKKLVVNIDDPFPIPTVITRQVSEQPRGKMQKDSLHQMRMF